MIKKEYKELLVDFVKIEADILTFSTEPEGEKTFGDIFED